MAVCRAISRQVGCISHTQQFTGSISILAISACMILAVRPKMLEGLFGGLDKMYRLHKWLGIVALLGSILHWTSKQFPKWLVKLGLFDGKKPLRPPMQEVLTLKDWLVTQRHFAEEVGEIAFYVAVVLLVIALIQLIPYRWFDKLHILIIPVYLALVWHTIVLANFAYWAQPLGWLLTTALFFGSICSLLALFKRIGKPQTATVTAMNQNGSLLSLTLNAPKWQGTKPVNSSFYLHMEKATHLPSLPTGILKIKKSILSSKTWETTPIVCLNV